MSQFFIFMYLYELKCREHQNMVSNQGRRSRWERARSHSLEFINWLQDKVKNEGVTNHIFWLAKGPNPKARRYIGYFVNGYRSIQKTVIRD